MTSNLITLLLAAGQGTRFKSDRIKVLHPILGKSMIGVVIDSITRLHPERVFIVVGYQKEEVMQSTASPLIEFVHQDKQMGTAHAVMAARSVLERHKEKTLLVMNGDLPLIRPETLRPLLNRHAKQGNALTFMSAELDDPTDFGRILVEDGCIRVVEEKEATSEQRRLKEINVGIYAFAVEPLLKALPLISNKNSKGEYYLTDIMEIMSRQGHKVGFYRTAHIDEVVGVNDRFELARAIQALRERKIRALSLKGVSFYDPWSTWIDLNVRIGRDTTVYPFVCIEGDSVVGRDCVLYPAVHIKNSRVGPRAKILTATSIEESTIRGDASVGPFAHLRPRTMIREQARIGNFVEMKNTDFGRGSKAGHLSYVGDSQVGTGVNIGAGTITCNYDGKRKNRTIIEDGVFIGSGSELVAPVKIGKDAYIGAGSTITKNVSPESLAVSRSRQVEKTGWVRRKRKK